MGMIEGRGQLSGWHEWKAQGLECHRSSVVERTLGKGEVTGSNPVGGLGLHVVVGVLRQ